MEVRFFFNQTAKRRRGQGSAELDLGSKGTVARPNLGLATVYADLDRVVGPASRDFHFLVSGSDRKNEAVPVNLVDRELGPVFR
jgi:hypothetical protein